ncbi:MAG: NAD(+) synthase [Candidatus Nomurabacteria bacterium]|jgi:NAD+ synthase|nr:NAD(+) synthase [Candidatus Nomurabacteria bacterium]
MKRFGKTFVITEASAMNYADKIGILIQAIVRAAGRDGVVLGLSGGVDSAVVAALCVRAQEPVCGVSLPYGDGMDKSGSAARVQELVERFPEIDFLGVVDIEPGCRASELPADSLLWVEASAHNVELAKMNIRARARMNVLYQIATLKRLLVIGTDNLSENVTGYFTKWGDGANDLQPLSMLTKREVYILARALGVPQSIIDAAPSAELAEGQTDEDELGFTYEQIDKWILDGSSGDPIADASIAERYRFTAHKREPIPVFTG